MKKLLFVITAVVISFTASAQSDSLTGCLGIKFGSNYSVTKSAMTSKPEFELYTDKPAEGMLSYLNGTFGGRKAVGAVFKFYQNQLHSIVVLVDVEQNPKVTEMYYAVILDLEKKYGISMTAAHSFKSPYHEGDGYTHNAIKLGYATMRSYHIFPDGNALEVSITESLSIKVEYQMTALLEKAVNAQTEQRNQDY